MLDKLWRAYHCMPLCPAAGNRDRPAGVAAAAALEGAQGGTGKRAPAAMMTPLQLAPLPRCLQLQPASLLEPLLLQRLAPLCRSLQLRSAPLPRRPLQPLPLHMPLQLHLRPFLGACFCSQCRGPGIRSCSRRPCPGASCCGLDACCCSQRPCLGHCSCSRRSCLSARHCRRRPCLDAAGAPA